MSTSSVKAIGSLQGITGPGRYATRLNRIVDITASDTVADRDGEGRPITKAIWKGMMMKADGRTPDCEHRWEPSGAYLNQRGVTSPLDIIARLE